MNGCILKTHKEIIKKPFKEIDEKNQQYIYSFDESNRGWLKENESRLICVLSVSLFKRIGNINNFNRMEILDSCITDWVENDQSVLIFIPIKNLPEYQNCFLKLNEKFNNKVKLVAYEVNPYTCGTGMVVGESRNAILDFLRLYKDIFKTCVISDERIFGATYGVNYVGILKNKKPNDVIDKLRKKYGYIVFNLVRNFIAMKPSEREKLRETFQTVSDDFDNEVKKLKIGKKYLNKAPICITAPLYKGMKILGQYEEGEFKGTLLKKKGDLWNVKWDDKTESTIHINYLRPANLEPNLFDSLRDRSNLTLLGFSSSRRYPFHANYSDEHLKVGKRRETEVMAQITMFRVNFNYGGDSSDYGWHGQQDYTKTTMCEDNTWSYDWDENESLGDVGELDSLAFQRKRGLSLTRSIKKVDTFSKCALEELVEACMSHSYYVTQKVVKMKWSKQHRGVSLGAEGLKYNKKTGKVDPMPYYFMACLLRDLYDACIRKKIDWKTDSEGGQESKEKVKAISDVLKKSRTLNRTQEDLFKEANKKYKYKIDLDRIASIKYGDSLIRLKF